MQPFIGVVAGARDTSSSVSARGFLPTSHIQDIHLNFNQFKPQLKHLCESARLVAQLDANL